MLNIKFWLRDFFAEIGFFFPSVVCYVREKKVISAKQRSSQNLIFNFVGLLVHGITESL